MPHETDDISPRLRKRKKGKNISPIRSDQSGSSPTLPPRKKAASSTNQQPAAPKPSPPPSQYFVSSWIFTRAMGILYFIFFFNILDQIQGLIGSQGISPIAEYQSRIIASPETNYLYWSSPSLFWLANSDEILDYSCYIGMALSIGLIFDISATLCSLLLWLISLSICTMGQEFFMISSDLLLLESGFLLIFLHKPSFNISIQKPIFRIPSNIILWVYRILLFRILVFSGIFRYIGSETWRNLHYFEYYFEIQRIPNVFSMYLHFELTETIQQALVIWILATEILMPFLIFINAFFRKISALYICLIELFFILSGNHGTFHFSIILLSILLFNDSFWAKLPIFSFIFFDRSKSTTSKTQQQTKRSGKNRLQKSSKFRKIRYYLWKYLVISIGILCIILASVPICFSSLGYVNPPEPLLVTYRAFYPIRIVNFYPLQNYPSPRLVLAIEASLDAHKWEEIGTSQSPDFRLDKQLPNPSLFINRLEYKLFDSASSTYEKEIW